MKEYEQLFKRYHSTVDLSLMLNVARNVTQTKLRRVAKKIGAKIHIKTKQNGSGVQIFYKLVKGEYQREYICDDEFVESGVEWEELRWRCRFLGNTKFDIITVLFNNRDRYLTYSEINELTGLRRNGVSDYMYQIEQLGLIIHKRNMKSNREIKLVGIGDKRQATKYQPEAATLDRNKLLSEVFR